MINIIINKCTGPLRHSMAHYEDLQENPDQWRKQLVRMDIITTEFQRRDKHRRQDDHKDRGKQDTFEDRIQHKEGSEDKKKKHGDKRDFVLQEQIDRRKKDSCCFKYGRKNYQAQECEYVWIYKTRPLTYTSNANQEPGNKEALPDTGHLRISELESEEHSANE